MRERGESSPALGVEHADVSVVRGGVQQAAVGRKDCRPDRQGVRLHLVRDLLCVQVKYIRYPIHPYDYFS